MQEVVDATSLTASCHARLGAHESDMPLILTHVQVRKKQMCQLTSKEGNLSSCL